MSLISDPITRTRYLVARSAAFRSFVGVDESLSEPDRMTAAYARTWPIYLPEFSDDTIPSCLVRYLSNAGSRTAAGGGAVSYEYAIETLFYSRASVDWTNAELIEAMQDFDVLVFSIIDQMWQITGGPNNAIILNRAEQLGLVEPPDPGDEYPAISVGWVWEGNRWGAEEAI